MDVVLLHTRRLWTEKEGFWSIASIGEYVFLLLKQPPSALEMNMEDNGLDLDERFGSLLPFPTPIVILSYSISRTGIVRETDRPLLDDTSSSFSPSYRVLCGS